MPSDIVIRIGDQFVFALGPIYQTQCVARTTKRRRCVNGVSGPQESGWTYIRRPGEPDDKVLSVYDLSSLDDDERTRWRNQHCPLHHRKESVVDDVSPEWVPFDPTGYVWTEPALRAWTDTSTPVQ